MNTHPTIDWREVHIPYRASCRGGLTLFEVLISLMIFATAMAVLGQLAANGVQAALGSRLRTQAVLRCQSKLAEVTSGICPLAPATDVPFPDDPAWNWDLSIGDFADRNLLLVAVTVSHKGKHASRPVSMTLERLVCKPASARTQSRDQEFGHDN